MTMRRNRPKKKYILALSALLAVAAIGGTYAYFSQDLSAENQFVTGKYDTDIKEEFIPPSDWMPGVEIPKTVQIENTGNVPVVAVARFDESCVRKEDITTVTGVEKNADGELTPIYETVSKAGDKLTVRFPLDTDEGNADPDNWQDIAIKNYPAASDVVEFNPIDDSVYDENSYDKKFKGKWVHYRTKDLKNPQDYFIYAGIIDGGTVSPGLLQSVTLNPLLQTTVTNTKMVAKVDENGQDQITYTNTINAYGYDNVNYKLTVNAKTVQATKAAVDEVLGAESALPTEMIPKELAPILRYVRNMCSGE